MARTWPALVVEARRIRVGRGIAIGGGEQDENRVARAHRRARHHRILRDEPARVLDRRIVTGYLVARKAFPGRHAMEIVSMINYALPGTIVGIAYLMAFNDPPIVLTGTAIVIVACYVFRYSPTGIRATVAVLQQIDPSIEEASVSLGADQARTFRQITLPLIRPAYLAGLIYSFARSMTTISAILFLTTPSTRIMTRQILNETESGRYGNAFAYVVILIAIVLLGVGVLFTLVGTSTGAERRTAERAILGTGPQ